MIIRSFFGKNSPMQGGATQIEENTYMSGQTLYEAIFEFGSPELIELYDGVEFNDKSRQLAKQTAGTLAGFTHALNGLTELQLYKDNKNKILSRLKSEILEKLKRGDLIPFGFKEPRDTQDKPIRIPLDLFFSGKLNWENSELKYREIEFTGIRILADLSPVIDLKAEKAKNPEIKEIENKSGKLNFANLEPDRYIDEKQSAEFLGISVKTLQGYRSKGGGPEFRKFGPKTVRYKFSDLKEWAEKRKKKNTSEII